MNLSRLAIVSVALAIGLWSCNSGQEDKSKSVYNQGINITPAPTEIKIQEGQFELNEKTVFVAQGENEATIANFFAHKIKQSTGYDLKVESVENQSNCIQLSITKVDVNNEGYLLKSSVDGVKIEANTPQGLFYGMQTLLQLLPAEIESKNVVPNTQWAIPFVDIKDEPRFGYRGQLLDASRHFQSVEYVKRQLDVLAMMKINILHWHLTDDQGWRIEIKKYPELTTIGATRHEADGSQYGPFFYTQEQIKDVVKYAKERFITIIPEIELPGHAEGTLAPYPQYSCSGKPTTVRNVWGVATNIYCAGNEDVFPFLEDIFDEVLPLFDSKYIHIGGDEAPKDSWIACPKCQAKIKSLGLKADAKHTKEEKLQSYFVQRMEKYLASKGRSIIGWDEILQGGLAPSATVMSWRGEEGGIEAGNMGHDVIMVPYKWLYIDYYQSDSKVSPYTIGGDVPLQKVYNYDPIPEKLDKDKQHHVIGVQANVWTEYMGTEDKTEWYTYPRMLALSEVGWSAMNTKNYDDFLRRLDNQRVRLDMHGINYYIPIPQNDGTPSCNYVAFVDSVSLAFTSTEPVKFVYTTDGTEPTLNSAEYNKPLYFENSTELKIRPVLVSQKMGNVRTITIQKEEYKSAVEVAQDVEKGLKTEYYPGVARNVGQLKNLKVSETEYIPFPHKSKNLVKRNKVPDDNEYCNTVMTGYINIPSDGVYYFSTDSEQFWIGDELLINNENDLKRHSRADKSIALAKGYHPVKLIRLSGTFHGWVSQWDQIKLHIRESKEAKFRLTAEADFR